MSPSTSLVMYRTTRETLGRGVYLEPPDHLLLGDFIGDLLHPRRVVDLAICGSILGVSHALRLVYAEGGGGGEK